MPVTVPFKSDAFPDFRGVSGASLDDPSGLEEIQDLLALQRTHR